MYINGVEEESDILIDNDADTCVNLTRSDGCKKDGVWNLFLNFELEFVHAQDTESDNACFNPQFIYSKSTFYGQNPFIRKVYHTANS